VLREYGLRYLGEDGAAGFARWQFVRAEPEPLRQLATFAGLRFMPDQGEVVHSLRTVVVDAEGRVVQTFVGNTWQPDEALQVLVGVAVERAGS